MKSSTLGLDLRLKILIKDIFQLRFPVNFGVSYMRVYFEF